MSQSEKLKNKFSKATRITTKSRKDLYDAETESENETLSSKGSTIRRTDPIKRKSIAPNRYGARSDSEEEEEDTGLCYLVAYLAPFAGKFSVVTDKKQIKVNKFDEKLATVLERGIYYDVEILRMGIFDKVLYLQFWKILSVCIAYRDS